jgi:proteasome lid subunit RPN8/RPN11
MSVKLTTEHIEQIKRHGERTFPEECGGLLLGVVEDGVRVIREILPLENIRKDSRQNRVRLSELDILRAEREAARRDLGLLGYYHSHPDHPAEPSDYDRDHAAWITWSYIIVSVRAGVADEFRAWTLCEDRSQFDEETMTLFSAAALT